MVNKHSQKHFSNKNTYNWVKTEVFWRTSFPEDEEKVKHILSSDNILSNYNISVLENNDNISIITKFLRVYNLITSQKWKKYQYIINNSITKTWSLLKNIIKWFDNLRKWFSEELFTNIPKIEFYEFLEDEELLYERLLFEWLLEKKKIKYSFEDDLWEKYWFSIIQEECKKRRIPCGNVTKWTSLTKEIVHDKPKEYIDLFLDVFGFIPREIYTKIWFYKHRNFLKIANFYSLLEKKQEKVMQDKWMLRKVKNSRSTFLKYAIIDKTLDSWDRIKWIFEDIAGKKIDLDTNWLKFEFFDSWKSINSHIPWHELDINFINYLYEYKMIDHNVYLETCRFYKTAIGDKKWELMIEDIQIDILIDNILLSKEKFSNLFRLIGWEVNLNNKIEKKLLIAKAIIYDPENMANLVYDKSIIIPESIFEQAYKIPNITQANFHAIFLFAHKLNSLVTKEIHFDNELIFSSYDYIVNFLIQYKDKLSEINNCSQYSGFRAVQILLKYKLPSSRIQDEFLLYRWKYRSWRKERSFIELRYSNNIPVRLLTDDKKHFIVDNTENLESIRAFEKDEYERLHIFFEYFRVYKKTVFDFNSEIDNRQWNFDYQKQSSKIWDYFWIIRKFYLNYFPEKYKLINNYLVKIENSNSCHEQMVFEEFLQYLFETINEIDHSLEKIINWDTFPEHLKESVKFIKFEFNADFLLKVKEQNLESYTYDSELCLSWQQISIAEINTENKKPTTTTLSELKAIELIWIQKEKKLIVVSWWCKYLGDGNSNPIFDMSKSIIKFAWKNECNVSIPCTQSWIWASLSQAYINHLDLVWWDKNWIHMFSVAPWKNVYYGDSETKEKDMFVLNPIDSIIIKNASAWWDLESEELIDAWYFDFIEWLEFVYSKIDSNKDRIHIIWNWWLFTVAEALAWLKNWAKVLLVSDSWRFAQVFSNLIENSKENLILNSQDNIEELYKNVEEYLKKTISKEDFEEWKNKDWWIINNNYFNDCWDYIDFKQFYSRFCSKLKPEEKNQAKFLLYRKYFIDFLNEVIWQSIYWKKEISITKIDNIENELNRIINTSFK